MKRKHWMLIVGMLAIFGFTQIIFAADLEKPQQTGNVQSSMEESTTVKNPEESSQENTEVDESKADESENTESESDGTNKDEFARNANVIMELDTTHLYSGMGQTYQQGYIPKISDGALHLILPVLVEGELQKEELTVHVDLGSPVNSPLIFKNYEMKVGRMKENLPEDLGERALYLICLDLALSPERTNGTYSLNVTAEALDHSGTEISKNFVSYYTITDGKSGKEKETVAGNISQPLLILEKSSFGREPIIAGEEFTVTLHLKNVSKEMGVRRLVAEAELDSQNFQLLEDSNTLFVEKVGKNQEVELTLHYLCRREAVAGSYELAVNLSYEDEDARTMSSRVSASVEVTQPIVLEAVEPMIAEELTVGDTVPISMQIMNLGRTQVYNVRCLLDIPGLIPTTSITFLGNLEAGTEGVAEFEAFVGKIFDDGKERHGPTEGIIRITYEDVNGNEYTLDQEISTTIYAAPTVIPATEAAAEEATERAGSWWISLVVVFATAAGIGGYCLKRRGKMDKENDCE